MERHNEDNIERWIQISNMKYQRNEDSHFDWNKNTLNAALRGMIVLYIKFMSYVEVVFFRRVFKELFFIIKTTCVRI